MASGILDKIGSDKGLLPDGTKLLPEPLLTHHQWCCVVFTRKQFDSECWNQYCAFKQLLVSHFNIANDKFPLLVLLYIYMIYIDISCDIFVPVLRFSINVILNLSITKPQKYHNTRVVWVIFVINYRAHISAVTHEWDIAVFCCGTVRVHLWNLFVSLQSHFRLFHVFHIHLLYQLYEIAFSATSLALLLNVA